MKAFPEESRTDRRLHLRRTGSPRNVKSKKGTTEGRALSKILADPR
jgi:hypothetical protein